MTQFVEQRLRFLQICRVEPLSKPAVDFGQHLAGLFLLALLPQPAQAHGRAEFQGFGLLLLSNLNGLQKIPLGFPFPLGAGN